MGVGSGDKNNLSCDNSTTSKGAVQLKNITSFLGTCESEINKTCNTANWPQPNKTKLASCNKLTKAFIIEAQLCLDEMRLNTTAVCYCWNAASFNKTVEAVKDCKFSTEASAIAKAKENCTEKFGKCRKYEDDALLVVASCSTGYTAIVKKISALKTNKNAVEAARAKVKTLSGNSTKFRRSAPAATCSAVVTIATDLTNLAKSFPTSPKVPGLSQQITNSS